MSGQGIGQILFYVVALIALGYPLGLYMARVYTSDRFGGRRLAARDRERLLQGRSREREAGAGLEELRRHRSRLQLPLLPRPLCGPAHSGAPVPEPGSPEGRAVAHLAEHGRQLHHQHELAVLRRRVHDVVPHPDGRARGAELRLGRGRHGSAGGRRARDRAPLHRHARQLLGRPLPLARLHPAAAGRDRRGTSHLAGRAADLRRARDRAHAAGRDADDRARPCRLADRDQAARHERRRLLQLELGRPVREPDRALELPRDARDPADPGRAGLHVREDGLRATARHRGVRVDARRLRCSVWRSTSRRSSTARRCCATRA